MTPDPRLVPRLHFIPPESVRYAGVTVRTGGTSYRTLAALFKRRDPEPVSIADLMKSAWGVVDGSVKPTTVRQALYRANLILRQLGFPLCLAMDGGMIVTAKYIP